MYADARSSFHSTDRRDSILRLVDHGCPKLNTGAMLSSYSARAYPIGGELSPRPSIEIPNTLPCLLLPTSHRFEGASRRESWSTPSPLEPPVTPPGPPRGFVLPYRTSQTGNGDRYSPSSTLSHASQSRRSSVTLPPSRHDSFSNPTSTSSGKPYHNKRACTGRVHVPGSGLHYTFEDGSSCPAVIDGEMVNPDWGLTKTGKARKRLAQACTSCRKQKIKCRPTEAGCARCTKHNLRCTADA